MIQANKRAPFAWAYCIIYCTFLGAVHIKKLLAIKFLNDVKNIKEKDDGILEDIQQIQNLVAKCGWIFSFIPYPILNFYGFIFLLNILKISFTFFSFLEKFNYYYCQICFQVFTFSNNFISKALLEFIKKRSKKQFKENKKCSFSVYFNDIQIFIIR